MDEENQSRFNALESKMRELLWDPDQCEEIFQEARKCLADYPAILAQYDALNKNRRKHWTDRHSTLLAESQKTEGKVDEDESQG